LRTAAALACCHLDDCADARERLHCIRASNDAAIAWIGDVI
jgi:hypothetical protein